MVELSDYVTKAIDDVFSKNGQNEITKKQFTRLFLNLVDSNMTDEDLARVIDAVHAKKGAEEGD
jgi:hypothetical protein